MPDASPVSGSSAGAIFLIGYRASGKTTIGKALAAASGGEFVDTDRLIEKRAGKSISAVFEEDGAEAFRDLESLVVHEVARRSRRSSGPLVVATGGGAVLRESNKDVMRDAGRVIWLRASARELQKRIAEDPATSDSRPALRGASAVDEVEQVLAERLPVYLDAAHHVIDTDGLTVESIVELVQGVAP